MIYKLVNNIYGEVSGVMKTSDDEKMWSIPFDPDNTDYQEYLEWLAEGNTPEPADS